MHEQQPSAIVGPIVRPAETVVVPELFWRSGVRQRHPDNSHSPCSVGSTRFEHDGLPVRRHNSVVTARQAIFAVAYRIQHPDAWGTTLLTLKEHAATIPDKL